uniref:Secreted protein n=1 Tax=Elaeophora elaphi TaxID=1147741 RepID=A0A0R3RMI0_9BILA
MCSRQVFLLFFFCGTGIAHKRSILLEQQVRVTLVLLSRKKKCSGEGRRRSFGAYITSGCIIGVAVLGVHGDDGSSSSNGNSSNSSGGSSCSSSGSSCCCSSNRRNRLTNYPVLVPPRWPVFVVVVGLVLMPRGEDWIVSAPALGCLSFGAGRGQGKLSSLLVRY